MIQTKRRVLVVDDNEDILLAARLLLTQKELNVDTVTNPERIPSLMNEYRYDAILLDMNFTKDVSSGQEGFDWLGRILKTDADAVVILITAYGGVETAVRAMKEGATDFVLKPWQNEKLWATVSAAMELSRSRRQSETLRQSQKQLSADLDRPYHGFVGECPAMKQVFDVINKVAKTDAGILILGENGTGKELVARELHRRSNRANELFVSVDIGALSESLFESELFGHTRGAFTDARDNRAGRFEIASGGTLFLDEIGNIGSSQQSKLLSAIENQQVFRLGSSAPVSVDIRLVSATNASIHERVANGSFRQDLLYRINTVEIALPPLRERGEDIQLLAEHFLAQFSRKYGKPAESIDSSALKLLSRYSWPGNVRELQHAIERAVIMSSGTIIRAEDFALTSAQVHTANMPTDSYRLEQVEKATILRALDKHNGNVSQTAKELGLTRASLYRRMQKYDL